MLMEIVIPWMQYYVNTQIIRLRVIEKSSFSFHEVSLADIVLEINKLDETRSNPVNTISANTLKIILIYVV